MIAKIILMAGLLSLLVSCDAFQEGAKSNPSDNSGDVYINAGVEPEPKE